MATNKVLNADSRADILAFAYVRNQTIPANKEGDALHIALASVNDMDCIVSYNFKHINRIKTKREIAPINEALGYNYCVIVTAEEVMQDARS